MSAFKKELPGALLRAAESRPSAREFEKLKAHAPPVDLVAHHEAGHAVMAYFGHQSVERVTIVPALTERRGTAGGTAMTFEFSLTLGPEPDAECELVAGPSREHRLGGLLGGPVAETLFTGKCNWKNACTDLAEAVALLTGRKDPVKRIRADVAEALSREWRRTDRKLREPANWRAVEALAGELLREGTVEGDRVKQILRKVVGAPPPPVARRHSGRTPKTLHSRSLTPAGRGSGSRKSDAR